MIVKSLTALFAILLGGLILGCKAPVEATSTVISGTTDTGIANPAAVYCEKQGYSLEIRTDTEGNQYGVCIFADGSECDEWAYFRGECAPAGQTPTTENKAVEASKLLLAKELNINASQVTVFKVQATDWPDSCLGLPNQGEACSMIVTPGFRVTLTAGETNYTYHTDLTGENIRLETAGVQG